MGDTTAQANLPIDENSKEENEAKTLQIIESSIKVNMAKIDRVRQDIKPIKEMLDSFLASSQKYNKAAETAKKAGKIKSSIKSELLQAQNGKELVGKIDVLKEELAEANDALSYSLREYQRLTGLNEFEGEDGELRQIVYVAKLVRKTNLNR